MYYFCDHSTIYDVTKAKCVYYDDQSETWLTDGVNVSDNASHIESGSVVCEAYHLTKFTVQLVANIFLYFYIYT